jgi:fatty acid desaturase
LALQIRDAGLLDRRGGYYVLKVSLTLAVFVAGWTGFFILGDTWTTLAVGVFLGLMFAQVGFIGHDAGHQQVFSSRRANRVLGLAVANALIGLNFGWWVPKHYSHHAHPNEIGRDPDIDEPLVLSSRQMVRTRPGRACVQRWRAFLFFSMMLFRSAGLYSLGIRELVRQRKTSSVLEGCLIALHAALHLTLVFWVLSPMKAIAFIAVEQAVFSLYLGCSFAPNHKGMPLIDSEAEASFVVRQVVSSRNVAGGKLTGLFLGGLNLQIEHHLFPTMPRPNLRRAQPLVRTFCQEIHLDYREESLVGSLRLIVRHLASGGTAPTLDAVGPAG